MKPPSEKLVRTTIKTPREDADRVGFARIFAEVDVERGQGVHVTINLKITIDPHDASSLAPVVGEQETSSAEFSDQHLPNQEPDDPEYGPHIFGLFGEPVRMRRPKRGWRRFGRRG